MRNENKSRLGYIPTMTISKSLSPTGIFGFLSPPPIPLAWVCTKRVLVGVLTVFKNIFLQDCEIILNYFNLSRFALNY